MGRALREPCLLGLSRGRFRRSLAGFFALDRLHHDRGRGLGLLGLDDQVAQNGVVVAERVFQLIQRGLAALDSDVKL
jgi:hypothetical protein